MPIRSIFLLLIITLLTPVGAATAVPRPDSGTAAVEDARSAPDAKAEARRTWTTVLATKGAKVQACSQQASTGSSRFGLLARHNPRKARVLTKWAYTVTDLHGPERNSIWWLEPGARPIGHASSWMPGGINPAANSPSDVTFSTRLLWKTPGRPAKASKTASVTLASVPPC
jgi:hypothetical protein